MVSDTMDVSQAGSRPPLLPLGLTQIHKQASTMNTEPLPFPGPLALDGTREVRYLSLSGQPKSVLKDWCREFKLTVSGNIPNLTDRLRKYSAEPVMWKSLNPAKTRSHKGPRADGKPKRYPKQSEVRRAALFESDPAPVSSPPIMHALPTERSRDRRTAQQIAMVVPWAENYVKQYPYQPSVPRTGDIGLLSSSTITTTKHVSLLGVAGQEGGSFATSIPLASLAHGTSPPITATIRLPHAFSAPPASFEAHAIPIEVLAYRSTCASDVEMVACLPSDLDQPSSTIPSSVTAGLVETRSLTLANGKVVVFTVGDVPDPAYIRVNKDIPLLASMWDDSLPAWRGVSVTMIQDQYIPLKFWPKLYRYWKPAAWRAKKSEWSKWKTIAQRYLQGTPAEFVSAFSVNGKLLSYTAIEKIITQARVADDWALSAKAHAEYGADFNRSFLYRRTRDGAQIVMTKDSSIARRYRHLQGEHQQDEDDFDEDV